MWDGIKRRCTMDRETVTFEWKDRVLRAKINCEIDNHTAKKVREQIDSEIHLKIPEALELDFSNVRFMDSSGLALIIGRASTMGLIGARVIVVGMSSQLLKLIRLSGIERIGNIIVR
jgi:stage II sporulation protein AA (anti-sigma F factor antagonist)